MKTAISIPDGVFQEAERLARRRKISRSRLYAEALAEYLLRHKPEAVTEAMNEVCGEVHTEPDSAVSDPAVSAAARRVLARSEW